MYRREGSIYKLACQGKSDNIVRIPVSIGRPMLTVFSLVIFQTAAYMKLHDTYSTILCHEVIFITQFCAF